MQISYQECIRLCNECATACDHCAASCLQEEDVNKMSKCYVIPALKNAKDIHTWSIADVVQKFLIIAPKSA